MTESAIDELKNIFIEARKELLINKNPLNSLKMLEELADRFELAENKIFQSTLALAYLENKNYRRAASIFYNINEKYQAGFCELLLGNIDYAALIWNKMPESSAVKWGNCLINLINLNLEYFPSFIQIRNHLECDLGYLIQANRIEYAESLIKSEEILASINPETYKFIGKALFNNGFANLSINYFMKSQSIMPNDPETYYHLGRYSHLAGSYTEARQMLEHCIAINRHYYPAEKLLSKINTELKRA